MMKDMYGDLLSGDDSSGYEYTEIMGDGSDGDDILGDLLGDGSDGEFVGVGDGSDGSQAWGESGDDILGAVVRAKKKRNARKQAMARDLMARRVASGSLLRSVAPRNAREYALGLGSTSVAGTSSANINVQPQVIFRPERLVVPSNLAVDFLITDIKVGKNSQLVSTGALPAVMFTEQAFGVRLKMDTAQISMFVTVSVTNQNPAARNFQGGLVGPAVE
jgi:hypothetical protein